MRNMRIPALLPLQVTVTDFRFNSSNSNNAVILLVFVVIAVFIFLFYRFFIKGIKPESRGNTMSGFALRRIVRNLGFSHEQIKMLDYVFKTDNVTDPQKSLSTPFLLDRHFRRAYRTIGQASTGNNETQKRLSILFSTRNILENSAFDMISSTQQIKDDVILTITYAKEPIKVSVLSARGDHIAVERPKTVLGTPIKIPKGTKLTAVFFTKSNKGFSFETRVVGYATMYGHSALQLAHSNQLRFLSHRKYRRKHAYIACFMFLVYVEGSGKKQRLVVDKRRIAGNIEDISMGGCSIKTNAPVQVGARFKVEFTQGGNSVAALGQVLRTNRTGVSTVIHMRFLRVSQKSMNIINAFVYEYANE